MSTSLPIYYAEQHLAACGDCPHKIRLAADQKATLCRKRGGSDQRECSRCWALINADSAAQGCPLKGKWEYPATADKPATPFKIITKPGHPPIYEGTPPDWLTLPTAPQKISLPVFPVEHGSPEWTENMKACRRCRYYRYRDPEQCAVDGKGCSTHALNGSCPKRIQPHFGQTGTPQNTPAIPPPHPLTSHALYNIFDQVRVISLERRPDRLRAFWACFPQNWPHRTPVPFAAIDGAKVRPTPGWRSGRGAYGCKLSHCEVLREAIADPACSSVLIFEDDAMPHPEYAEMAGVFFASVPSDWAVIWLGGHELGGHRSKSVNQHVRQMTCPHRCHAYAVRGRDNIAVVLARMEKCSGHIDHCLGKFLGDHYRVYAPSPAMLVAQAANTSNIDGKNHGTRWWGPRPQFSPTVGEKFAMKEYASW